MIASGPRKLRVFLCHASADKPAARKLYRYLRSQGMDPWLDVEKLVPGQRWEDEIPKALFGSDAIIVIISTNSITKEGYVQREIKFALDKALDMPEGRIFLIPARLEECDPPQALQGYQWVDLFHKNWNRRLMLSLNQRMAQLDLVPLPIPPKASQVPAINAEGTSTVSTSDSISSATPRSSNEAANPSAEETSKFTVEAPGATIGAIGDHANVDQNVVSTSHSSVGQPLIPHSYTPAESGIDLEQLLSRHQDNLARLQTKKAVYASGQEPLSLLNEIEKEKREIQRIQTDLAKRTKNDN